MEDWTASADISSGNPFNFNTLPNVSRATTYQQNTVTSTLPNLSSTLSDQIEIDFPSRVQLDSASIPMGISTSSSMPTYNQPAASVNNPVGFQAFTNSYSTEIQNRMNSSDISSEGLQVAAMSGPQDERDIWAPSTNSVALSSAINETNEYNTIWNQTNAMSTLGSQTAGTIANITCSSALNQNLETSICPTEIPALNTPRTMTTSNNIFSAAPTVHLLSSQNCTDMAAPIITTEMNPSDVNGIASSVSDQLESTGDTRQINNPHATEIHQGTVQDFTNLGGMDDSDEDHVPNGNSASRRGSGRGGRSGRQRQYDLAAEKTATPLASRYAATCKDYGKGRPDRFRCGLCPMTFDRRYNVKVHMRWHTGECPFTCRRCNKGFLWRSSMSHHKKMHAKYDRLGVSNIPKKVRKRSSAQQMAEKTHNEALMSAKEGVYADRSLTMREIKEAQTETVNKLIQVASAPMSPCSDEGEGTI